MTTSVFDNKDFTRGFHIALRGNDGESSPGDTMCGLGATEDETWATAKQRTGGCLENVYLYRLTEAAYRQIKGGNLVKWASLYDKRNVVFVDYEAGFETYTPPDLEIDLKYYGPQRQMDVNDYGMDGSLELMGSSGELKAYTELRSGGTSTEILEGLVLAWKFNASLEMHVLEDFLGAPATQKLLTRVLQGYFVYSDGGREFGALTRDADWARDTLQREFDEMGEDESNLRQEEEEEAY
jgi:hypothetical protein